MFTSAPWSALAPHADGKMCVGPLAFGRYRDLEHAYRLGTANLPKEQVAIVVNRAARHVLAQPGGPAQHRHRFAFAGGRVEPPYHPVELLGLGVVVPPRPARG